MLSRKSKRRVKSAFYYSFCLCCCPTNLLKSLLHLFIPASKQEWEKDQLSLDTFASLQLSKRDVLKLQKSFQDIDEDGSGTIDLSEFLKYVCVKSTPFSSRVFSIMDEDGNGKLDFREFVIACWNYCSFGKNGLILFAYDLYDADSNGSMNSRECLGMFMEVFGSNFNQGDQGERIQQTIAAMSVDDLRETDVIKKSAFVNIVGQHMGVLQPAFMMQAAIRTNVMGHKFWDVIEKRRAAQMEEGSWKKNTGAKAVEKIDTRALMNRYRADKTKELLQELKAGYKSKLIGRLGEYNPQLDTERRVTTHTKLKGLNFDSFEDLNVMKARQFLPQVLTTRYAQIGLMVGNADDIMQLGKTSLGKNKQKANTSSGTIAKELQALADISNSSIAKANQWVEGTDYKSTKVAFDDSTTIKNWQKEMVSAKDVAQFTCEAPKGYEYIGNVSNGPMIKLQVNEKSKIVDWSKANLANFEQYQPEENSDEEDERIERQKTLQKGKTLNDLLQGKDRDVAVSKTAEWSGGLNDLKEEHEIRQAWENDPTPWRD